jgi:hypothetical protein
VHRHIYYKKLYILSSYSKGVCLDAYKTIAEAKSEGRKKLLKEGRNKILEYLKVFPTINEEMSKQ